MTEKIEDKEGSDIFSKDKESIEPMFDDSGSTLDLLDEIAMDAKETQVDLARVKKDLAGKNPAFKRGVDGFLRDKDGYILREDVPEKQPVKRGRAHNLKYVENELAKLEIREKARKEKVKKSYTGFSFWKRIKKVQPDPSYLRAKEVLKNNLFQLERERGEVTSRYYRNQQEQIDKHGVSRW